jgi:hypothetical protein
MDREMTTVVKGCSCGEFGGGSCGLKTTCTRQMMTTKVSKINVGDDLCLIPKGSRWQKQVHCRRSPGPGEVM